MSWQSDASSISKTRGMSLRLTRMKLNANTDFHPCHCSQGDEIFRNGIFEFNVTKMLEWIRDNRDAVVLDEAIVSDFPQEFSSTDEAHMDSVQLDRPVILAEISPGGYNVIDGNHRLEKARRMDVTRLPAFRLDPEQHIRFLTSRDAYVAYVKYWNEKLKDLEEFGLATDA
jgi:hypothetical protein